MSDGWASPGGRPVLLVTGGTRGIGAAVVQVALGQGANVAFCGRSVHEPAGQTRRPDGPRALAVHADVTSEGGVGRAFDRCLEAFGRVDAVVSNAAVNEPGLLVSLDDDQWDRVVTTNLTAGFLVARRALRQFQRQDGRGAILFMGSLMQEGSAAGACYATSKAAQLGLARAIAHRHGRDGVTANVVVVGYVETELTGHLGNEMRRALVEDCPMRRQGTAQEVAAAVCFLTLGDGRRLNGQVIRVSGGLTEVPARGGG